MALAENGFDIAPKQIEQGHVPEEMPWAVMQKHRGNELPGVSVVHTAIVNAEVIVDEARLGSFENKLRNKNTNVDAN